jgi:uncharacterized heparinase superfamily protein
LHHREIRFGKDGRLEVSDRVSGQGRHKIESFLHFHPDLQVERRGAREVQLSRDGVRVAMVTAGPTGELHLEEGRYCPEFGVCRDSAQLRVIVASDLPATITYSIEKA